MSNKIPPRVKSLGITMDRTCTLMGNIVHEQKLSFDSYYKQSFVIFCSFSAFVQTDVIILILCLSPAMLNNKITRQKQRNYVHGDAKYI